MYLQKTFSVLIQNIQNYKNIFSKYIFYVKFSNFFKVSIEKTILESVFSKDIFHVIKITLDLGIFLNLYYLKNIFFFFYTKCLKSHI